MDLLGFASAGALSFLAVSDDKYAGKMFIDKSANSGTYRPTDPKGINHSNLHASSTVMTFKSFSSKSFTFLVTR